MPTSRRTCCSTRSTCPRPTRRASGSSRTAACGVPVLEVSVKGDAAHARAQLLPLVSHGVTLLLGASGVGKSTLINTLVPDAAAQVGEISQALNAGRHTTTTTSWYWLDDRHEAAVLDSPGFQEFGLLQVARRSSSPACCPTSRRTPRPAASSTARTAASPIAPCARPRRAVRCLPAACASTRSCTTSCRSRAGDRAALSRSGWPASAAPATASTAPPSATPDRPRCRGDRPAGRRRASSRRRWRCPVRRRSRRSWSGRA